MPNFSHLHVHTQFSLLDGAADIKKLMKKAKEDEMKAIAITDHGNMFGAFRFVAEANNAGIKPIVGCEFYMVEDRHQRQFTKEKKDKRYHQLLLAKNDKGYQNLSKLCSYGETRIEACNLMQEALNNFEISGIENNLNLLSSIIKNKKFLEGDINTGFIDEEYPDGFSSKVLDEVDALMFSLTAVFAYIKEINNSQHPESQNNSSLNEKSLVASIGKNIFIFKTYNTLKNTIIEHNGKVISLESDWKPEDKIIKIKIDDSFLTLQIKKNIKGFDIKGFGLNGNVNVRSKISHDLSSHMIEKVIVKNTKIIKCPMPGLVVSIDISEGQKVEDGDKLCTVEAMKMENIIRSETTGIVKKIFCKEGDSLAADEVMIEFQ